MTAITESDQAYVGREPIRPSDWLGWRINWSAVWVGALVAFTLLVLFGLIGVAIGAHMAGPAYHPADLKTLSIGAAVLAVCGAFVSSVVGGWAAAKVAGIRYAEPAILQGAVSWLVLVPILALTAVLGGASLLGGWYAGLTGSPVVVANSNPAPFQARPGVAADQTAVAVPSQQSRDEAGRATRNSAVGALTALLLGLLGSVVGGWFGSGEPMNLGHYKTRKPVFTHY